MARTLINVPPTAKRGEVIEIKTLISHPMETGFRTGPDGALIPRDIIYRFTCTYNGEEIFSADLFPAITANPFITFTTVATASGELAFSWTDDKGQTQTEGAKITVKGAFGPVSSRFCFSGRCPALVRVQRRPTTAAPASTSWDRRPRRCRAMTPPTPA